MGMTHLTQHGASDAEWQLKDLSFDVDKFIINQQFSMSVSIRLPSGHSYDNYRYYRIRAKIYDNQMNELQSIWLKGSSGSSYKNFVSKTFSAGKWYSINSLGVFDATTNGKYLELTFQGRISTSDSDNHNQRCYFMLNDNGELTWVAGNFTADAPTASNKTTVLGYTSTKDIYVACNHNLDLDDASITRNSSNRNLLSIDAGFYWTSQCDYISQETNKYETISAALYKNDALILDNLQLPTRSSSNVHDTRYNTIIEVVTPSSVDTSETGRYKLIIYDNYGGRIEYESLLGPANPKINLHLAPSPEGGISFGKEYESHWADNIREFYCDYPMENEGGILGLTNFANGLDTIRSGSSSSLGYSECTFFKEELVGYDDILQKNIYSTSLFFTGIPTASTVTASTLYINSWFSGCVPLDCFGICRNSNGNMETIPTCILNVTDQYFKTLVLDGDSGNLILYHKESNSGSGTLNMWLTLIYYYN